MDAQTWAIALLQKGVESDAILRLAAERSLHWQDETALINVALTDIGQAHLQDDMTLLRAYEKESVEDYLQGAIDGATLVQRGCDLYYDFRPEQNEFLFWIGLAEEFYQYDLQEPDPATCDDVLRSALRKQNRFSL